MKTLIGSRMVAVLFVFLSASFFAAFNVQAIELKDGDWTFSVHGNVNTHYIYASCDDSGVTVAGNALLCTGKDANAVSNGYLPASLEFGMGSSIEGYDIKAVFAYEPGTVANSAFNGGYSGNAVRAFFTVGNENMGTLKGGRDYGVFGLDVILQDMSLIGVGAHGLVKSPLNTTFGSAGYGYIFVDRISQLTYSFPVEQFDLKLGVYQPLDLTTLGSGVSFVGDSGSENPGVHGTIGVSFENGFISSSFLTQSINSTVGSENADYQAYAFDVTGKFSIQKISFVASYFNGKGVGHSGLFFDAADTTGEPRDSQGCFLQGKYTIGKTALGISYGMTLLDKTNNDPLNLLNKQGKITAGVYHNLITNHVTLVGEYSHFNAENHSGADMQNDSINIGVFFGF